MFRQLISDVRAFLDRFSAPVWKHCHLLDLFLRLSWPFLVGQLVLFYFLTATGQGREILLESVVIPPGTAGPGFLDFGGIGFGFFIEALAFSWIVWMMTRSVISLVPNRLQQLATSRTDNFESSEYRSFARIYCYKLPCLSSLVFLVLAGGWLASYSGPNIRCEYLILHFCYAPFRGCALECETLNTPKG